MTMAADITLYGITLFGIKNCDQIKKARRWLDAHQVEYHFHDYRLDGVPAALTNWLDEAGTRLINRNSSSWRALTEADKQTVDAGDTTAVVQLLNATPTLIKRPLLVAGKTLLIGFNEADWNTLTHSREATASPKKKADT